MIAANDEMQPLVLLLGSLTPAQLRSAIAHAAGLHAHYTDAQQTADMLCRIAGRQAPEAA